jgi:enoyl-CoA hydratase/carnithine racemase
VQPDDALDARVAAAFASADFAEGFSAFVDKRVPRFD